jgi:hypothetical protein
MKAYFEYISENENSFRRFRFQCFLVILFLSILLSASFLFTKKDILKFRSEKGVVALVSLSKVRVKPGGTYDLRKFIEKDAIEIKINEQSYFVRYKLDQHRDNVFQKIHVGDSIVVYFDRIENHLELYEILKNGESILDYSGRKYQGKVFSGILFVLLIISIFLLTFTIQLRKKHLSRKGNIF